MKIQKENKGEPVAWITHWGNLVFAGENKKRLTLLHNGGYHTEGTIDPSDKGNIPVYAGDTITITF